MRFYAAYNGSLLPAFRVKTFGPKFFYLALDSWTIGCPETWLKDCRSALHKIPKQRRSRLHRGEGLKSRNFSILLFTSRTYKRPLSFTLHSSPISTLISSPCYMARCTTLDSPDCVIFFIFLLPPTS